MAKIVRDPIFVDDVDGTTSEENGTIRTRVIRLEEGTLTIDLSDDNYGTLMDALSSFIDKGEWTDRDTGTEDENALIRKWARDNGKDVSARGRLSKDLVAEYREYLKSREASSQPTSGPTSEVTPDASNVEPSNPDNGSSEPATLVSA